MLADEEREDVKLVIVGINRAGDSLVQFGEDLNARISIIRFESNPPERVMKVVTQGEQALQVAFTVRDEIVEAASGSFFLAQYLCHETCLLEGILERQDTARTITTSFEVVRERVMESLARRFADRAMDFARGTKLRREGRAPYLHILKWLADANEWSIQLDRMASAHPELKGSVTQVVEKGYLAHLLNEKDKLQDVFHYDAESRVLAVEDPQFVFYIRNLLWNRFAEQIGFLNVRFDTRYDFALSFAGADRPHAELLFELLQEQELEVFYDKNEQHRILAENVEDYLAPIYRSEARYVVCLLGPEYPKRIWTKFESQQFRERFGEKAVIPIWFTTAPPGMFDETTKLGGMTFDPTTDVQPQLESIAKHLVRKLADHRSATQLVLPDSEDESD